MRASYLEQEGGLALLLVQTNREDRATLVRETLIYIYIYLLVAYPAHLRSTVFENRYARWR